MDYETEWDMEHPFFMGGGDYRFTLPCGVEIQLTAATGQMRVSKETLHPIKVNGLMWEVQ